MNKYWVGNGGNWSDSTNHWASASGGAPDIGNLPTLSDNAIFDSNSFSLPAQTVVTDDGLSVCKDLDFSAVTNNPTITFTANLTTYGDFKLKSGMTVLGGDGPDIYAMTQDIIIDLDGVVWPSGPNVAVQIDTGRTCTLANNIVSNDNWFFYGYGNNVLGTFDTAGYDITARGIGIYQLVTVNLGDSVLTSNGTLGANIEIYGNTNLNIGTSKIVCGNTLYTNLILRNSVLYDLDVTEECRIQGGPYGDNSDTPPTPTFRNVTIASGKHLIIWYQAETDPTVTLNITGTIISNGSTGYGNYAYIRTTYPRKAFNLVKTSGAISDDYLVIRDSHASGGATFTANLSIDKGGNTGWSFTNTENGDRFWVGDSGDWFSASNWATSTGGAPGAEPPGLLDDAIFDANSFSIGSQVVGISNSSDSIAQSPECKDLDLTAVTNSPELDSNNPLSIYGNTILVVGMSFVDNGGGFYFRATSSKTITSGGLTLTSLYFEGIGGTWTLQDPIVNCYRITINAGTFTTSNNNVTITGDLIVGVETSNGNTVVINLGSSVLTLTSDIIFWGNAITLNAGTSSIVINCGNAGSDLIFGQLVSGVQTGRAYTFYDLTLNDFGDTEKHPILGTLTFNNLTINASTTNGGIFLLVNDLTVTGTLSLQGTAAHLLSLHGAEWYTSPNPDLLASQYKYIEKPGTARTITAAVVNLDYIVFHDITGAGAAVWSGTGVGNGGGNTNITFAVARTLYWIGNAGNWHDPLEWSTSSGGAGNNEPPRPQDDVVFDANSFSADGHTVTVQGDNYAKSVVFTNIDQTFTLNFDGNLNVYGNFTATVGVTEGGAGGNSIFFRNRTDAIFTSGTNLYPRPIWIHCPPDIKVSLGDSTSLQYGLKLYSGVLDLNDNNLTITYDLILMFGSVTKKIYLGSGTLTTNGTMGELFVSTADFSLVTIYKETSTIVLNDSGGGGMYMGGKDFATIQIAAGTSLTLYNGGSVELLDVDGQLNVSADAGDSNMGFFPLKIPVFTAIEVDAAGNLQISDSTITTLTVNGIVDIYSCRVTTFTFNGTEGYIYNNYIGTLTITTSGVFLYTGIIDTLSISDGVTVDFNGGQTIIGNLTTYDLSGSVGSNVVITNTDSPGSPNYLIANESHGRLSFDYLDLMDVFLSRGKTHEYRTIQSTTYSWATLTGAATEVLSEVQVDGESLPINLPFNFQYFGDNLTTSNTFVIDGSGFICFDELQPGFNIKQIPDFNRPGKVVAYLGEWSTDVTGVSIKWEVLGSAPNRILVIQFTGMRFLEAQTSNSFQIKLFETSNKIELHYQRTPDYETEVIGQSLPPIRGLSSLTGQMSAFIAGENGYRILSAETNTAIEFSNLQVCGSKMIFGYAGVNSVNNTGNTGWYFTAPPDVKSLTTLNVG